MNGFRVESRVSVVEVVPGASGTSPSDPVRISGVANNKRSKIPSFPPVQPRMIWSLGDGKAPPKVKTAPGSKLRHKIVTVTSMSKPITEETWQDVTAAVGEHNMDLLKEAINLEKGEPESPCKARHEGHMTFFRRLPNVFHRLNDTKVSTKFNRRYREKSLIACAPSNAESQTAILESSLLTKQTFQPGSPVRTGTAFKRETMRVKAPTGVLNFEDWFDRYGKAEEHTVTNAKGNKGFMTQFQPEVKKGFQQGGKHMNRGNFSFNGHKVIPYPSSPSRLQMKCNPGFGPGLWVNRGLLSETI